MQKGGPLGWAGRIAPEKGLEDAVAVAAALGDRLLVWGVIEDQKYASLEISNPDNWLKKRLQNTKSLPNLTPLSQKTQFEEKLIMNLRISEEISISIFDIKKLEKNLGDLIEYDLLIVKNEKIILKEKGKRMLNYISKVLLDCY